MLLRNRVEQAEIKPNRPYQAHALKFQPAQRMLSPILRPHATDFKVRSKKQSFGSLEVRFRIVLSSEHAEVAVAQLLAAHLQRNDIRAVLRRVVQIESTFLEQSIVKRCLLDRP